MAFLVAHPNMFLNLPHTHEHGYQNHQHNYENSYEHLLPNLDVLTVNKQIYRSAQMVLYERTPYTLRKLLFAVRLASAWIS